MKLLKRDKLIIYGPIIIAVVLVIGIFLGNLFTQMRVKSIISTEISRQTSGSRLNIGSPHGLSLAGRNDKINSALYYVLNDYVDSVPVGEINEDVVPAILNNLDPHSVYIPAVDFQKYNEPLTGNFSGIGVLFNMNEDTVAIIRPVPNGPSELVGIQAGDRIVEVEGTVVAGVKMDSDEIVSMLKGEKGTPVNLKIKRRGEPGLIEFEIIRDDIPIYSVDVSYMIDDKIGYVKISSFAQTTYKEFINAVEKLKSQGMEKIIVDLRNNGGGIMDAAIKITDQFLDDGRLIVYTQGRSRPRKNDYATSRGLLKEDDVVVLIDESSASASEILAGAIQDNDRGLIVGRRSFGKGLVQEQMTFSDGSAIRLTVAKYYTPTGRSIQKPYDEGREEYYNDISYRFLHGEFENEDSISFSDSLKFVTPGGRVVYGGGGIMPDLFVPVDTTFYSPLLSRVTNLGLTHRFAFQYTDLHREELEKMTTPSEITAYLDDLELMRDFTAFANSKNVQAGQEELDISGHYLLTQIKAYIARNILDNEGFYPIIREVDYTLNVAIDTLSAI
ncbi:MAG: S41 family peptidase [Bacteroidales bacterium]|nr:S41 family peptidase [Bacteroidales bacterium]MDT8432429.1 S41 family peptidase [Bacteroidales bacterium]